MVSVGNNLALCSGVIDLRSVVEGVRVAERCFAAAQPAAEREAVCSQLCGSVGAGGSCLERIRDQWQGTALAPRLSLRPSACRHGCSCRGDHSCCSKTAWVHTLSSNTGGTSLPLALSVDVHG